MRPNAFCVWCGTWCFARTTRVMVCLVLGPHFVAALRSCERVTTRGEGRMFYVRVPGARCVGFLLFVADRIGAALEACSVAAACVRVCAFTAASVVAVS